MSAVGAIPAVVPAASPARPRVLLIGTALAIGGCGMAFASLLGIYLATRADVLAQGEPWLPAGAEIPLSPGTMALVTFALSIITMQWAVYAVGNNDRQHATMALALTLLFGLATINATSFLYTQMNLGLRDSSAAVLIYVISGAHVAMTVAAMVFTSLMTFRTLGGEYAGRDCEGIVAASMFWYATIAVYAVLWYTIYVTK
ncbi:MAG: cytochrome c oxidase subunit 3 [Acidimicrobiales bacterium]